MRRESDISAVHTFYSTLLDMNLFSLQLFQLPGIVSYFCSNFEILLIDSVTLHCVHLGLEDAVQEEQEAECRSEGLYSLDNQLRHVIIALRLCGEQQLWQHLTRRDNITTPPPHNTTLLHFLFRFPFQLFKIQTLSPCFV